MTAKERPFLLTGREVRAVLSGQKTQARRLVHPDFQWIPRLDKARQPDGITSFYVPSPDGTGLPLRLTHLPAYPGDRLWCRETFALEHLGEDGERVVWKADRAARWLSDGEKPHFLEYGYKPERWTPAVQMSRRLSRITLEVTRVRVERLQNISEEDAKAEGLPLAGLVLPGHAAGCFARLWDETNGKRAPWSSNPWCWVLEFKRVEQEGAKAA